MLDQTLITTPAGDSTLLLKTTVHQLFEQQVARTPGWVAVEAGGSSVTYADLNARANAVAAWLRVQGVKSDSRVAICCRRSIEMVVAVCAVLKAGAGYVPLDPSYPVERLAFMLEDAAPIAMLVHRSLSSVLPDVRIPVLYLDDLPSSGLARPTVEEAFEGASTAYVIYTSGSTGQPKGVVMPHTALVNLLQWHRRALPLMSGERVLQFAPLSFDVSFQEIFTTLAEGGTLILIDEELRRDPDGLLRYMIAQRIQRLYLPFVALQQLAEAAKIANLVPPTLKDVVTAGEQLQISDAIRWFFQQRSGLRLHNHYGPSETHVVTAHTLPVNPLQWATLPPIGQAIDGAAIHLFDANKKPVPFGTLGELYISGVCVARGYLNRDDLTAERFSTVGGYARGERLYRTGDLARRRDDGEIEFLGRADDQVKIRGHRIELGEVECAVRKHSAVRDCAAVAQKRDNVNFLVAYIIARGTPPPADDLRSFLLAHVPEPMIPSLFLPLAKLPLTPSGKVDRRSLPPIPSDVVVHSTASVPPSGDLECAIARVWESVLRHKGVGAVDSFFSIGGTSLLIAHVQRQLRTELRQDVPIAVLFRYPTIRELARHIGDQPPSPPPDQSAVLHRASRQRDAALRQQLARRPKSA